jgi:carbamoyl-phosphate synthase large subunit
VMEHIEEAGVHSGDSACSLPPVTLPKDIVASIAAQTKQLAMALNVRGLMNVQYAVKGTDIYVLEVNPRASRTVPFVSKAIGVPLAKLAAKVMAGKTLAELGFTKEVVPTHYSVKEAVFPFLKFSGVDVILGPEMLSTGEVMGISNDFGIAFAKSQIAASNFLPKSGTVFFSVRDADKAKAVKLAQQLYKMGFKICATKGTCMELIKSNIPSQFVLKVTEGRPNIVDSIINKEVALIINCVTGKQAIKDSFAIRRTAVERQVPYVTTIRGATAIVKALDAMTKNKLTVSPIQAYYKKKKR